MYYLFTRRLFMNIAIMGYGVVGSGVAEVIEMNRSKISAKGKQDNIEVKYILDLRSFPDDPFGHLVTNDFNKILNDDSVEIVVECMGGVKPAYEYVLACLKAGKSVATSNKQLVAEKGVELLKAAEEGKCQFMFEAAVAGGIPLLRPINRCLAANEITGFAGILNGTTNFILTMMIKNGMSFDDALALAQKNGYAEADPTADVEGHDACRKVAILCAICFGKHVYPDAIHTEGISGISLADVEYASAYGCVIKLLGRAEKLADGRINAVVSPAFVKKGSMLAGVDDVFNAVLVRGNAVGDVLFYGRGAGKLPTASAVVSDVIDCAAKRANPYKGNDFSWGPSEDGFVAEYVDTESAFYVRLRNTDKHTVTEGMGDVEFLERTGAGAGEIAIVVPPCSERNLRARLNAGGFKAASIIPVTDY